MQTINRQRILPEPLLNLQGLKREAQAHNTVQAHNKTQAHNKGNIVKLAQKYQSQLFQQEDHQIVPITATIITLAGNFSKPSRTVFV